MINYSFLGTTHTLTSSSPIFSTIQTILSPHSKSNNSMMCLGTVVFVDILIFPDAGLSLLSNFKDIPPYLFIILVNIIVFLIYILIVFCIAIQIAIFIYDKIVHNK